jgi:undecaprenyl-diphosphatase
MEFDILYAIQSIRTPWLDDLMMYYTTLGDSGLIWVFLAIGLIAFPATRFMGKVSLLSLLFEVGIVTFTLKPLIDRIRPCAIETLQSPIVEACYTDPSFPSGHTASSFAAASMICFEYPGFALPAFFLAVSIAFSRLYLRVHYPSDVLAGAFLGATCSTAIHFLA